MAYTRHGHVIIGSPNFGICPIPVRECGGPVNCDDCALDVDTFRETGLLPILGQVVRVQDSRVQAVIDAWNDPGRVPSFHRAKQNQLRHDWPVLWKAVRELAEANQPQSKEGNE